MPHPGPGAVCPPQPNLHQSSLHRSRGRAECNGIRATLQGVSAAGVTACSPWSISRRSTGSRAGQRFVRDGRSGPSGSGVEPRAGALAVATFQSLCRRFRAGTTGGRRSRFGPAPPAPALGTTIVAALAGEASVCYGGVGDRRICAHCAGTLDQVTEDDSWLASIAAAGPALTEQAKAAHPMRHVADEGARRDADNRRRCDGAGRPRRRVAAPLQRRTARRDQGIRDRRGPVERGVRARRGGCCERPSTAVPRTTSRRSSCGTANDRSPPPIRCPGRTDRTGPAPPARTLRAAGAHREGRHGRGLPGPRHPLVALNDDCDRAGGRWRTPPAVSSARRVRRPI